MPKLAHGRGWAYTGAWLGGALSVGGNIGNSFVPPDEAPAGWTPVPGAVIFSAAWPIALVIVAEVVIRTPWPRAWYWIALRLLGLVPVGVVSGVVSFRHLRDLLGYFGEDDVIQVLGPLAVDGLMITCAASLFATSVRARTTDNETPVLVRLAGQFATVRSLLSTDKSVPTPFTDTDNGDTDNEPDKQLLSALRSLDMDGHTSVVPTGQDNEPDMDKTVGQLLSEIHSLDKDNLVQRLEAELSTDSVRPVSLSLAERVSLIDAAFPDRIPYGREIKKELGIASQGVVTDVLRELRRRRGLAAQTTNQNSES